MVGMELGDEARRRRCAEDEVDELRDQLKLASPPYRSASSRKCAASSTTLTSTSSLFQKASKNSPAKPSKINGRISSIRPFHKVWVKKQPPNHPDSYLDE